MKDKSRNKPKNTSNCPDTEMIACYIDGILSVAETQAINQHTAACKNCKEIFDVQQSVVELQKKEGLLTVPDYITERAKNFVSAQFGVNVLELIVKFTDKAIEVIRTTGDVLFGGELQPALAVRGQPRESATTQTIVKVFDNIRVEVEVGRQKHELNRLILRVKDNQTETPLDDLRATLIEKDIELESYITQSGKAIFENIKPGKYFIRISKINIPIGLINLEFQK